MTTNDQDIAWASLPSYSRELARNMYKTSHDGNVKFLLENLYGTDNLTSDTEPEEMLMVERKYIQEMYADGVGIHYLSNLFGDKCLPDKEQPKPKFKAGDIVIAKTWVGEQFPQKIVMVANDVAYFEKGNPTPIEDLEPYTEENKETMNRCEKCGANAQQCADSHCQDWIGEDYEEKQELNKIAEEISDGIRDDVMAQIKVHKNTPTTWHISDAELDNLITDLIIIRERN